MAGTRTNAFPVRTTVKGYSAAAVVAAQILGEEVMAHAGRILAVKAHGVTAGTGGGNTVLDVQINGVSAYTITANRPTKLATGTGEFDNTRPNITQVAAGDRVSIVVLSISTTGHARLMASVAIGMG